MSTSDSESLCKPCVRKNKPDQRKNGLGTLGGILLIILPKCPFCFMAFSSSLLLCGEGGNLFSYDRLHNSTITIILSALFCAVSIIGIAMVYRDIRSRYAMGLACFGALLVMTSVIKTGGMPVYYIGAVCIFLGVWLNSSLLSFLKYFGIHFQLNPKTIQ